MLFYAYLHGVVARHSTNISSEIYRLFVCFLHFFRTLSVEAVFRGRNEYQFFALTGGFLWLATSTPVLFFSGVPIDYSVEP